MSTAQRLVLILLALAVLATFGILATLIAGGGVSPRPTPAPSMTSTPAATGAPSASPTPTSTHLESLTPPPTKPAPTFVPAAFRVDWLGVGDFDGDGRGDLAAVDAEQGTLSVYAGAGTGWDGPAEAQATLLRRSIAGRPVAFAIADLDADGASDLLIGTGGAPDEHGLLLVWGRRPAGSGAPWAAQTVLLRSAPIAVLSDAQAGTSTVYVVLAGGFQTISLGADRQARVLPFVRAPVRPGGSAQASATLLRAGAGAPAICYFGQSPAGVGTVLASYRPAALAAESLRDLETLKSAPRAMWPDPSGSGDLLIWEGEAVRMGRLGQTGGGQGLLWQGATPIERQPAAVWPARLGPQQTPALLALERERTALLRYVLQPSAPSGQPATRYAVDGVVLALTLGDVDGDSLDDLVMALQGNAGDGRFETWSAAGYAW